MFKLNKGIKLTELLQATIASNINLGLLNQSTTIQLQ